LGIFQRQERIKVRITLIAEEEKQGEGLINFITLDGTKRYASFRTEEYDGENDMWAGEKSEMFNALQKAFDEDKWITLILVRVNSEKDSVKKIEP